MRFTEECVCEEKEYEITRQRVVPLTKIDDIEAAWCKWMINFSMWMISGAFQIEICIELLEM